MYKIDVDEAHALIEIAQEGLIKLDEAQGLTAELRRLISARRGRSIKILVDARLLHPVPPGVDEEMRAVQAFGISNGVVRVAQVVDSSVVLLQRTRIMRESGSGAMTRIFRDRESARHWLIHGGEPDGAR